jgi:putative endonuclease
MAKKDDLGRFGEQLAADYLARRGYVILDRNWRSSGGEIDIVARHDGETVFVEVKTRSGLAFGNPLDAITPAKHARLRRLVGSWHVADHGVSGTSSRSDSGSRAVARVRIDVIGIVVRPGRDAVIDHLVGIA